MKHFEYIATSREGFVQQIVSGWVRNGYHFYVQGEVPEGKDPTKLDEKFLFQYPVAMTAAKRHSRKKRGLINVAYLRYERRWIMLATAGGHDPREPFCDWRKAEGRNVRDCRRGQPIQVFGYSISYVPGGFVLNRNKSDPDGPPERDRKRRVRVQIARPAMRELKAKFLAAARTRRPEWFAEQFWRLPYEPYAPVRKQLLDLLRQINAARKAAGLPKLSTEMIRYRQRRVKVFGEKRDCAGGRFCGNISP